MTILFFSLARICEGNRTHDFSVFLSFFSYLYECASLLGHHADLPDLPVLVEIALDVALTDRIIQT